MARKRYRWEKRSATNTLEDDNRVTPYMSTSGNEKSGVLLNLMPESVLLHQIESKTRVGPVFGSESLNSSL